MFMKQKRKMREKRDRIISGALAVMMLLSQISVPQYSEYAANEEIIDEAIGDVGPIDEGSDTVQLPSDADLELDIEDVPENGAVLTPDAGDVSEDDAILTPDTGNTPEDNNVLTPDTEEGTVPVDDTSSLVNETDAPVDGVVDDFVVEEVQAVSDPMLADANAALAANALTGEPVKYSFETTGQGTGREVVDGSGNPVSIDECLMLGKNEQDIVDVQLGMQAQLGGKTAQAPYFKLELPFFTVVRMVQSAWHMRTATAFAGR